MEKISLALEFALQLLKSINRTEREILVAEIKRMEDEWENDKQKLLKALAEGDIATINTLLSRLLDDLYEG